jgi:hypothetical protein
MFVCCECCVLSGRGLCDGLITCPEESYRLWCVAVCDQETSKNEESKAPYRVVGNTTTMGCNAKKTSNIGEMKAYIRIWYSAIRSKNSIPPSIMDISDG